MSKMVVNVKRGSEFAQAVQQALQEERALTYEALHNAVDKTAKETVDNTKRKARVRTGAYKRNWKSKKELSGVGLYGRTVYNDKPTYRLTHLLQNGHAVVVRGKHRGRAPAFDHIQSDDVTAQLLEQNFEREMNKG